MNIFLAGNVHENRLRKTLEKVYIKKELFSFLYINLRIMEIQKEYKVELFLDSGAYSAKTQNVEIDIYDYINFIKQNKESIHVYANLDVIGDARGTFRNQTIMEEEGLHPLPVFHLGEDERYLKLYIKKYDYICLGGLVGSTSNQLRDWLELVFPLICDSKGIPTVKVHGFGITSIPVMLHYPWYSIDSTTWIISGRMGSILVPRFANGHWIYDERFLKVDVSNKNPSIKVKRGHLSTMNPKEQEVFLRYIHEKGYQLGKSEYKMVPYDYELKENECWVEKKPVDKTTKRVVEIIIEPGISNKYRLRDELNIIYFSDLEKHWKKWPWAFKSATNRLLK